MATTTDKNSHTLTLRVPHRLIDQVRSIAERESESHATVIRRLIRRGLDSEQRQLDAAGQR